MENFKKVLEEFTDLLDKEEFKWGEKELHWKDPNHTGISDYIKGKVDGLRFAQNTLLDLKRKYNIVDIAEN